MEGSPKPVMITREKLLRQVWETTISRLAATYGISGNGLAKTCDRLTILYPPRGYWAKKAAGKTYGPVHSQMALERFLTKWAQVWRQEARQIKSLRGEIRSNWIGHGSRSFGLSSLHKRIRPSVEPSAKMEIRASWAS